jgi:hypothetical protein
MGKQLVEVIMEVLDELGASDSRPVHRSEFNPIIESRWRNLGNVLDRDADFGQAVSAELQRFCADSSVWTGSWSVRDTAPRGDIALVRVLDLI